MTYRNPETTALYVAPLWPAGHLPHKGGDQLSAALSPIICAAEQASQRAAGVISPLVGEMAGRPEGGAKERQPISRSYRK